ncbi:hypothetical protein SASPL_112051 [Salvia splendens]|uniref:Protein kinase domain-containing protein n=1 Tax=Salvia splendens TaxID=180675 RepID=A0A8X8YA19_SALSN|nr:hypothetical protein SASPL_112051 [Salvia splendens]
MLFRKREREKKGAQKLYICESSVVVVCFLLPMITTMPLLPSHCLLLLFSLPFFFTLCVSFEPRNPEVEALTAVREGLVDPHGALSNWDENSVDPCSWSMITCNSDALVTAVLVFFLFLDSVLLLLKIWSSESGLIRNVAEQQYFWPYSKRIGYLPNLQTLDLSNSYLHGHIPESLGLLNHLQYIRLNNNSLSGPVPLPLANLPRLTFLDLSFNNLSGPVPTFPTKTFNIPGNPLICGSHSSEKCSESLLASPLSFAINPTSDVQEEDLIRLGNLKSFSITKIRRATNNFSSKNILGAGGFGNVYRSKLEDGMLVAVKRLKDLTGTTGISQFRTELEMISLAVHWNLLRLFGCCATQNERLLVYPYMSNGSVASRLRGKLGLDWNTRKRIAIRASRGLLYLHEQCDPKIIHQDVKAANILLDDYCEAVVGDFGLAKLLDHGESHVTTAVRGTVGHIAPEYLSTGQSSDKTDVFGFGILLLELITGMRALEFGKTVSQKGAMLEWGDGLAEKWAASHNYIDSSTTSKGKVHGCDELSMFGMEKSIDDGCDANCIELSGPR